MAIEQRENDNKLVLSLLKQFNGKLSIKPIINQKTEEIEWVEVFVGDKEIFSFIPSHYNQFNGYTDENNSMYPMFSTEFLRELD